MDLYSDTAISRYISRVQQFPRLSRERELELFDSWRTRGDLAAKDDLVRSSLRYVVAIALKYRHYGLPLTDLIAEGNVGILHALGKFDPELKFRFVTYSAYWIRAFILGYVIRSWSLVGTGSGALRSKMFFKLRRERVRITNLVGEGEQANELLAARLNLSREQVVEMVGRLSTRDISLDSKQFDDSGTALVDTLVSSNTSQEEAYSSSQRQRLMQSVVQTALNSLDRRERFIVEQRAMANADEEKSLAELGRQLGISRERARQLETRAMRKLRTSIAEMSGGDAEACLTFCRAA
jgi:RNA polymerase sigma-32 factor